MIGHKNRRPLLRQFDTVAAQAVVATTEDAVETIEMVHPIASPVELTGLAGEVPQQPQSDDQETG